MKKQILFITVFLYLCSFKTFCQKNDFDKLIPFLIENNWTKAHKQANAMLKKISLNDSSADASRLRYMYIYSLAGLVGERKIDRNEALEKVKIFEGTSIEMPGHPVNKAGIFSCYWYKKLEDTTDTEKYDATTLTSCAANNPGTFIHSFEEFTFTKPVDLEALDGQVIYVRGILSNIELRGMMLSVFGLKVTNCFYYLD